MSACSTCTYINHPNWVVCDMCGAGNSVRMHMRRNVRVCQCYVDGEILTAHFEGSPFKNTGWECPRCTFWQVDLTNPRCVICEELNPTLSNENKAVSGLPLVPPREELPLPEPEDEDNGLPPLEELNQLRRPLPVYDLEDDLEAPPLHRESLQDNARRMIRVRLHEAVKQGRPMEEIEHLLALCRRKGVGCSSTTLKFTLAHEGFEDLALRLLQFFPLLLTLEGDAWFFLAARHGRVKVLSYALSGPRRVESWQGSLAKESARLVERASSNGETALQIAARIGEVEVVALLLRFKPSSVGQACWSALNNGVNSEAHEEVMRLLLEHDPELIRKVDFRGNTILHYALGGDRQLFRPEFMRLVWSLHPPALHRANICGVTPFQRALWSGNEFALRTFQGELPLDEGMSFVTTRAFLDSHCATPLHTLPRELLDTVYHYLGFEHKREQDKDKRPEE